MRSGAEIQVELPRHRRRSSAVPLRLHFGYSMVHPKGAGTHPWARSTVPLCLVLADFNMMSFVPSTQRNARQSLVNSVAFHLIGNLLARRKAMLHKVTAPPTMTTRARSGRSLPRLPWHGLRFAQTPDRFDAN